MSGLTYPQAIVYSVGILCVTPIAIGVLRAVILSILEVDIIWWRR